MKRLSFRSLTVTAWNLVCFSAVCAAPGLLVFLAQAIGFSFKNWWFELSFVFLLTGIAHVIVVYAITVSLFEIALHRANTLENVLLVSGGLVAGAASILFFMWRFLTALLPTTLLAFLASFFWVMSNVNRYADSEIPRNISTVICIGLALVLVESFLLMSLVSDVIEMGSIH